MTDPTVRFYNSRGNSTRLPGSSLVLTPLHDDRHYLCPGDAAPVSRAVHLARLAASYEKCAACPQRLDVNSSLPPVVLATVNPLPARTGEFTRVDHGFRSRYVDPLNRARAAQWAAAFAALLWDERIEEKVRMPEAEEPDSPARMFEQAFLAGASGLSTTAPIVVVGYDERSGAPDLFTGIVRGLERMSCTVIDIGLTTEPCLRFAIQHLNAEAGLVVTGAGCDPAWLGFDVFRRYGLPPEPDFLDVWQEASTQQISRPSRSPGHVIAGSVSEQYAAALTGRFHAVRPLTFVCGVVSRHLLTRMEALFARLPGRIELEAIPVRRRDLSDPHDADVLQVGRRVRECSADFGIVIGDDGAACGFLDERGSLIAATAWQRRIIDHRLRDDPRGIIVLDTHVWDELAPTVTSAGGKPLLVASADRAARLMYESGLAAFGDDHRVWFGGETLTCDGIATIAAVWQALSRSDMPASEALGRDVAHVFNV